MYGGQLGEPSFVVSWHDLVRKMKTTVKNLILASLLLSMVLLCCGSACAAFLYFPHVDTNLPWQTEIAVINTGDQTLTGTLRGLSNEGQNVGNPLNVTLAAHGRRQINVADEFTNHTSIGYIVFDSDSSAVQGYTKFYQEGKYRVAVPAVKYINTGNIYITHIDSSSQWWTGIGLVNTTSAAKTVTITFNNGQIKQVTLPEYGHRAFAIRDLFGGQPQPDIKSGVITNASGVIGLELFATNDGKVMEGILLTDKIATTLYYPHVAGSDGWTGIVAYNPSDQPCTITVTPYSAQGAALAASNLSILGKQKYVGALLTDLPLPEQTAWFRIDSTLPLSGFELIGTNDFEQLAGYVDAGGLGAKQGVFAKIEKGGWNTVVLVNTEDSMASITLTAYDDNGSVVATRMLTVGSYAKSINSAEGYFYHDMTNATYIALISDKNMVGLQLNRSTYSTMLDGLPLLYGGDNGGSERPVRDTTFGKVAGARSSTNASYYWVGIPYAAPPVGSLRWQAPVDPTPWTTTRSATSFGNACMQVDPLYDMVLGGEISQSEDCLTLNIWSPSTGETDLPVLVFIHGGGHIRGFGGQSMYWGGKLASEQKMVVVTLNYRLNVFGWFNHSALKTGAPLSDSGNFGTLDIVQALKFIKNNIANFGGDPNNVTLAGQSAGSSNTWSLIVSPIARGLFHKAVPMSSGQSGTLLSSSNVSSFATNLLRQLVIDEGNATNYTSADAYIAANLSTDSAEKEYLFGKSASALVAAFGNANVRAYFSYHFYDGVVQPTRKRDAFTGIYLNNVPVVSGITNEEGKRWGDHFAISSSAWWAMCSADPDHPTQSISDVIQAQYLPANRPFVSCSDSGYNALALSAAFIYNDRATWCSNGDENTAFYWWLQIDTLNRYQPLQPNTYAYNFCWTQMLEPMKTVLGAFHFADVPFMFGNFDADVGCCKATYSTASRAGREALSLTMRRFLSAFMRTGDPNNASLGMTWNPWSPDAGGDKRLVLDADNSNIHLFMSNSDGPIEK